MRVSAAWGPSGPFRYVTQGDAGRRRRGAMQDDAGRCGAMPHIKQGGAWRMEQPGACLPLPITTLNIISHSAAACFMLANCVLVLCVLCAVCLCACTCGCLDLRFLGCCCKVPQAGGSFEANPPFVASVMLAMVDRIEELLGTEQCPLSFAVIVPGWLEDEAYQRMSSSAFTTYQLLVAKADHGFCDGAQVRQFMLECAAPRAAWGGLGRPRDAKGGQGGPREAKSIYSNAANDEMPGYCCTVVYSR